MPTYIRLVKFSDEAVRSVRTTGAKMAEARKIIESNDGKLVSSWSTLGRYDVIAVVEAPDNETMMKISALIAEKCVEALEAPIVRVTGFDTPFPNTLEHHYLPDHRRVLDAIERVAHF